MEHTCGIPALGRRRQEDSLGPAGLPAQPTCLSSSQIRALVSKNQGRQHLGKSTQGCSQVSTDTTVNGHLCTHIHQQNHRHLHTHTLLFSLYLFAILLLQTPPFSLDTRTKKNASIGLVLI